MKQLFVTQGKIVIEDIPEPLPSPGEVLVRTAFSTISTGTELSSMQKSGESIAKKVSNASVAQKVLNSVRTRGLAETLRLGQERQTARYSVGYSASGIVAALGDGVTDVRIGERVACAGTGYALHAEVIRVPRNLLVRIPENVSLDVASTVALGAIALQGVRRASPALGEWVVVYGLGLLGQITVQMLKANGCNVVGIDLLQDRIDLACSHGLDMWGMGSEGNLPEKVMQRTGGHGADAVIVAAGSKSNEPLSLAFQCCRKKGRVVLVGDVGLGIKREDIYQKELDFLMSTSYGPGRYDQRYEAEGQDYPFAYVRWTENRNMEAYLELLKKRSISFDRSKMEVFDIGDCAAAYDRLRSVENPPLLALFRYGEGEHAAAHQRADAERNVLVLKQAPVRKVSERVGIAVIGAGAFARGTHLPNIKRLKKVFDLRAIAGRSGHGAKFAAEKYDAAYATTDVEKVLEDPGVQAVVIATRHNLHGELTLRALRSGKHVLVEKPLTLYATELKAIQEFYKENPDGPVLMVGFNRRFSKPLQMIRSHIASRTNPLMVSYRVNAGYVAGEHWVHGAEGGGRNLGEACHFYDIFTFLTDAKAVSVAAKSIVPTTPYFRANDNFQVLVSFSDGSVCGLIYTAAGNRAYGKERMELYCDGDIYILEDYRALQIVASRKQSFGYRKPEKGWFEELEAFGRVIQYGGLWPMALWEIVQATEVALRVEAQINGVQFETDIA